MQDLPSLGRLLIVAGLGLCLVGGILVLSPKLPFLGRLPGDLVFGDDRVTVYIPLATMIVVSLVLTILLNLAGRFFK